MSRAERRHHYARLKKARKGYWGFGRESYGRGPNTCITPRQLGILVNTPEMCNCKMCNRPRRVFGDPIADIRRNQFDPEIEWR